MGRPWEYPRWKRALMQVTMWLILGGTLGLAQFVSHARQRSSEAQLGPPRQWGRLIVRLPKGWPVEEGEAYQKMTLDARDPEDPDRLLILAQELPSGDSQALPDQSDQKAPAETSQIIEFPKLGRTGKLSWLRGIRRVGGEAEIQELLRADVRLDDGLSLTIAVGEMDARSSRADQELLRQIAAAIAPGRKDGGPEAGWVRVKLGRPNDSADILRQGNALVVQITSADGSGSANLHPQGAWPAKLVIRLLNFGRLDRISLNNGRVSLTTRLGQSRPTIRWLENGVTSLHGADADYATVVRPKDDDLEIVVPPALYSGGTGELVVNWADFVKE